MSLCIPTMATYHRCNDGTPGPEPSTDSATGVDAKAAAKSECILDDAHLSTTTIPARKIYKVN